MVGNANIALSILEMFPEKLPDKRRPKIYIRTFTVPVADWFGTSTIPRAQADAGKPPLSVTGQAWMSRSTIISVF
jgi:hypothetical protein